MNKSLSGKTILITRDKQQSFSFIEQVEALAGKCLVFPTINISAPKDWSECDRHLQKIHDYDWIIFSSANAVRYFLERFKASSVAKYNGHVAAVGQYTLLELEKSGWHVELIPNVYSAQGLFESFKNIDIKHKHILIPSSNLTREALESGLVNMGARVQKIIIYQTLCASDENSDEIRIAIANKSIDVILFFSPSAVKCFIDIFGRSIVQVINQNQVAIGAIGTTTQHAIQNTGLVCHIQPKHSTREDLITAIENYFSKNK
jgi:uroporphyrinogen-III synthase